MTPPRPHHVGESIKLPRWLRRSVYAVTAILYATGIVWLIAHYTMRTAGSFGETTHPLEPWMLRGHGLAVMLGLFLYGTLLRAHIVRGWRVGQNRLTGALLAAVLLLLTASGYLLYYAGGETLRPILSVAHWATGLAIIVALPLHVRRGRRARSQHKGHVRAGSSLRHDRAVHR